MDIILTCSECGYHEWGRSEAMLMNKIKLVNHADKRHPGMTEHILAMSLPRQPLAQTLNWA